MESLIKRKEKAREMILSGLYTGKEIIDRTEIRPQTLKCLHFDIMIGMQKFIPLDMKRITTANGYYKTKPVTWSNKYGVRITPRKLKEICPCLNIPNKEEFKVTFSKNSITLHFHTLPSPK